ncbi:MAG TPA: glucosidase [Dongiaceae bacterium]|nr:glucosidase [Dongiaceae bacterium]
MARKSTPERKSAETARLAEARDLGVPWRKWGPYLSERQWGTVREDYSENGDAWNYFSHDQARSRAYRWGEDGLGGISDDRQHLCFALALWNGKDPILKERLFGLTNSEGNHGEDVKEYYFYLDSTPTHSYMKYLYKYPQAAYPYSDLVETNRRRTRQEFEYELLDTGVFDGDRYFDIFVEYAKASPEDILIQISVANRGPEPATLRLLPTLWFRNTWSWGDDVPRPVLRQTAPGIIGASHPGLGERFLSCDGADQLLFTENETNNQRVFGSANRAPYVKDSIDSYVVHGRRDAVNPEGTGTKASAHYLLTVGAGETRRVRLRLHDAPLAAPFGSGFDSVLAARQKEADEFYASVIPAAVGADGANVMRQALAGMLWSKQFYYYDVDRWLGERGAAPFKPNQRKAPRNERWHHIYNADVISMPDKWEYPWYAAWDLAFHVLSLTLVDEDFGKHQLDLMLQNPYIHPSGQIPAYEWNFGDVNPPVHAWSTIFTYNLERARRGEGDLDWLERAFQKLTLNFTWWVNRKDRSGNSAFEGGFLGLDNIGVFDRSAPLPTGGYLEQADGTAWMALFCQNMIEIAAELTKNNLSYADMALKFAEHFLWIANALIHAGDTGMWDEEDGFFYDVLRLPDGRAERLKVRSMVGLLPLCAVTVFDGKLLDSDPELRKRYTRFLDARPGLRAFIHDPLKIGQANRRLASALDEKKLRRVLATMLDEKEFLGPYGIRALSRFHEEHPYVFEVGGQTYGVSYLPAESDTGMFGGNSNWRGPIWMPVNALIIRALLQYHMYYGDDFLIECPTGSGRRMNLYQVAQEIGRRLTSIFLRDKNGRRPVYGGSRKFQEDPHWRDLILFYEYFHGDSGAGLGASHQTGWTGVIARIMHLFATSTSEQFLELGRIAAAVDVASTQKEAATSASTAREA